MRLEKEEENGKEKRIVGEKIGGGNWEKKVDVGGRGGWEEACFFHSCS